jgi:hypothetical protein
VSSSNTLSLAFKGILSIAEEGMIEKKMKKNYFFEQVYEQADVSIVFKRIYISFD